MPSHVILVAFEVEGEDRQEAMLDLMDELPRPGAPVVCWWVAEDDRIDNSDNDSAVFVHPGAQDAASRMLHAADMTADCNVVDRVSSIFEFPA